MAQYDALLQPFTIKGVTLRNRVMSTSHAPAYCEGGKPTERYRRYHEEKAKGGIGLTMFGGTTTMSIDAPAVEYNSISAADDSIIEPFQLLADRVHGHGAKLMVQLTHIGRKMPWDGDPWLAPIAPSRVREPLHRNHPKAMEDWDFRRVIRDYGQAARRAKEGGLDGVELQCAYQNLLDSFWTPHINKRTDQYGGSLEDRMRFPLEVFEEVRKQVGGDFIVSARMSGDEYLESGLAQEDCLRIAQRLTQDGLVDMINVIGGQMHDRMDFGWSIPSMNQPMAPQLHLASAVRAEIEAPVIYASRITDPETANRAVADGHVDLVGMTRGHMADPQIVNKLTEGRPEDIRECVGAAYCVDRAFAGQDALCIQNPATGREERLPQVIESGFGTPRKVVVVGAGPGGLEAARVSAARGHDVVLLEKADKVGGQVNVAALAPKRESLSGIPRWLEGQVRKLGVDLRLETEATAEMVMAEDPDVVVIATGGEPDIGVFEGTELATSTWDILEGKVAPGERVLIHDDQGRQAAAGCAEMMMARGAEVEFVTPDGHAVQELGFLTAPFLMRALYDGDAVITPDTRLVRLQAEGNHLIAILRNIYNDREEEREVDQVVAEHGTRPNEAVYFALKDASANGGELDLDGMAAGSPQPIVNNPDGRFQLYRVGDALASRNIHAAIYDSLRICHGL